MNSYEICSYESFEGNDGEVGLTVSWDYENTEINDVMEKEIHPKLGSKTSHLWIEKVKEVANWKRGEEIYMDWKQSSDGWFTVWYRREDKTQRCFAAMIDKKGYVSRVFYQNYVWDENEHIKHKFFVRLDCEYNDKNTDWFENPV